MDEAGSFAVIRVMQPLAVVTSARHTFIGTDEDLCDSTDY
jgi:hypothetical protein